MCVNQRVPLIPQHDVAEAVASVLSDTTLHPHAASQELVYLPPKVHGDSTTVVEPLPSGVALTTSAALSEVSATTDAVRVLSKANPSSKPIGMGAGCPIAAVSSETPPQPPPPAFLKQACGPRRDARRLRRSRGRHRAPLRGVTPTSSAVRRRRSPSSSDSYHSLDAVDRSRDAMLRLRDLSDGETFERGAPIGFATIRFCY